MKARIPGAPQGGQAAMLQRLQDMQAEMQRTQINNYCNNEITRLDIDVLARICTVFDCEIGDLLEFIPPEK